MKKISMLSAFFIFCPGLNFYGIAQSTVAGPLGNTSGIGIEFNGWNAGIPKHLDIINGHPAIWNMNFYTNAGAGPVWANKRQTILGNYSATGGLIGIGDMGTSAAATFAPFSLLHSYRAGYTDVFHQFSNDNTGAGGGPPTSDTEGMRLGIRYDNVGPFCTADGSPAGLQRLVQTNLSQQV